MRRLLFAIAALAGLASEASAQLGVPADKGLPVVVDAGVAFVELQGFDENAGTFDATVDVRIRWEDLRLRLPPDRQTEPAAVFRDKDAETRLEGFWTPPIEIANMVGDPSYATRGLRTWPDGRAELTLRMTATFRTPFHVWKFPFDRQTLDVQVVIRQLTAAVVLLRFRQSDLDFSSADGVSLDGWRPGFVSLEAEALPGWYGASHPGVTASLEVKREPGAIVASIFIPLVASLLIPLLALWLNRTEDGKFQIETFELVNLIIGGLFAVIALNFTVNADFAVLASGDNAVSRLFSLNYVTLGVCLAVNVLFYRFQVLERLAGRWVQEQTFQVLTWAIPAIVLTTAAAIVMTALV
jgi:hypothetical protein